MAHLTRSLRAEDLLVAFTDYDNCAAADSEGLDNALSDQVHRHVFDIEASSHEVYRVALGFSESLVDET
jgi:hypothetical protein